MLSRLIQCKLVNPQVRIAILLHELRYQVHGRNTRRNGDPTNSIRKKFKRAA